MKKILPLFFLCFINQAHSYDIHFRMDNGNKEVLTQSIMGNELIFSTTSIPAQSEVTVRCIASGIKYKSFKSFFVHPVKNKFGNILVDSTYYHYNLYPAGSKLYLNRDHDAIFYITKVKSDNEAIAIDTQGLKDLTVKCEY